jgi:protein O-GlcNAc transferase
MSAERAIGEALAALARGDAARARDVLRAAVRRAPLDARLALALARAHVAAGETAPAGECLRRAAALGRHDPGTLLEGGEVWLLLNQASRAEEAFRRARDLDPRHAPAHVALARAHLAMGEHDAAWAALREGVAACPQGVEAYYLGAGLLLKVGRVAQALALCDEGLARFPDNADLLECRCYALNFTDADPVEHRRLHERLGVIVGGAEPPRAPARRRAPGVPLRVGFLSGELCFHAVAFFLAGLAGSLDRRRVEPVLYANNPPDETTMNFARLAPLRVVDSLTDDALAAMLRADAIDVLVECNGWTGRHRMRAVSRRLAPVQATYLGYPNTTGLRAVDVRLVDALTDPAGTEAHATEHLLRLGRCFVAYTPPGAAPAPVPTPWMRGEAPGPTFGCFNRLAKMTARALRLWATLLARVPGARLLLKPEPIGGGESCARAAWAAAGGRPEQLDFAPFEPDPARHLAAYGRVDVALDPFPYNGTTSTFEALWMGVPVVTLSGSVHRARVGTSILTHAGLADLVATDEEAYTGLAARLAADRDRLAEYRRTLRGHLGASQVCDAPGLARALEDALEAAWRGHAGESA